MERLLNFAHRGFTSLHRENTIESFEDAIRLGVDGIECDVQETADHKFAIFHDSIIYGGKIASLSLDEVRSIAKLVGFTIPALEDVVGIYSGRARLMLDLKQIHSPDLLLRILRKKAEVNNIVLTSFDQTLIVKISGLGREFKRGVIIDFELRSPSKLINSTGSLLLVIKFSVLNAKLIEQTHDIGKEVFVWGCQDSREIEKALEQEIDGIISDSPDLVLRLIGKK
jgi:glycerophosphoryl diester phosphodiesterase